MAAADVVLELTAWAEGVSLSKCGDLEREEKLGWLLERVAVGNQQALGELYDATSRVVYGLGLRITGSKRAAVKVTEAVYADLWEQSAVVAESGDPLVWLVERTRAEAMNHRRRIWSRLAAWLRPARVAIQASARPDSGLEGDSWQPERRQAVSALEGLTAQDREVLELAYFACLKPVEIARELGLSEAKVRDRIRQGVRNFRERLTLRQLEVRVT